MQTNPLIAQCALPEFTFDKITIGHGGGGRLSDQLLEQVIFKLFSNPALDRQHDGAILDITGKVAISTDSFVVSPVFFPGGNIGDLAINGTMNDLAMCGARPKYLSLGLILEEGLPVNDLWTILQSVRDIAIKHGVEIVTGDTKVVESGKGDKIFINTTGIGEVLAGISIGKERVMSDDLVIVSGPVATHGMAIMSVREGLEFRTTLQSDTVYVGDAVLKLLETLGEDVHFLRDPTRGGVATVLNEMIKGYPWSVEIAESSVPVLPEARSSCEMLGLDPLYVANEGIFIAVVAEKSAQMALEVLQANPVSASAVIIGQVKKENAGKVIVKSSIGGRRVLPMMVSEQLPRIC